MLHDPGSWAPPASYAEISLAAEERDTLRRLAAELARAADNPHHAERAALWTALNDLHSARPLVWITEVPWHEMNVDGELTVRTRHPWAREMEAGLRRTLYQWRHMPADMVIGPGLECPLAIQTTGFGISEDVQVSRTDPESDIVSRSFHPQIRALEDLQKIRMPVVTHDGRTTETVYGAMVEIFSDIMPVQKVGQTHIWFAPWDYLVRWWGVEEALLDLVERPELVNAGVERLVDAYCAELDQFRELGLLALDCGNTRVGSGGYGYTGALPGPGFDPRRVAPGDMWGCSNAQIFSGVSPDMLWEFSLRHDMRWLERWGLSYYGCCEPLHDRIHLLRRIPNLRKISMSAWCDFASFVERVGDDYVISFKPSPAILAQETWQPERARAALRQVLDLTRRSCHVEIIMADISTVRRQPRRLWEWARMALETAAEYA
jgi:hypothetical protein